MDKYEIRFKESVWADLKKLPKNDLEFILAGIEKLGDNPRCPHCEKIAGYELYRVRQGSYRIVHSIQDNELTIWGVNAGCRKEACR
jgi:mRNA-degrading endonuclease RelE of RelBE toxin-antitoxin system